MSAEASQSRTVDLEADKDDHPIRLLDSTIAGGEDAPYLTTSGSWRRLGRVPTRTSVKEQLSRRKYASWRKDKFDTEDGTTENEPVQSIGREAVVTEAHPENGESQTVDFGRRPDTRDSSRKERPQERTSRKKEEKPDHEIDILYENQRGSFFCGIPLYSHSSLLNFDPAAWVTKDLKNSPVNITNAQVPDPSWMWAWKTWYVDMSHDVDEEGWQYSFSFGKNFAWHGTHPWLYSFVRRRRWLRKRVKRSDGVYRKDNEGTMGAAHHLNTDYFTIHSRPRDRSPAQASNPEAQLAQPASYTSFQLVEEETARPEDIVTIPALMKAIRNATVDREKVDAVKLFISNGGDELFYLEEHIPEIMSKLIFQNSRRQILQQLNDQAEAAQQHRDNHDAEERPEGPNEKQRIDNLLKAAQAAKKEIQGLEYWSDRKHVLQTEDDSNEDDDPGKQQKRHILGEIKGISDKAETSVQIRVDRRLTTRDKGKQPESKQSTSDDERKGEMGEHPPPANDTMFIPDKNESEGSDENAWKGQSAQPIGL